MQAQRDNLCVHTGCVTKDIEGRDTCTGRSAHQDTRDKHIRTHVYRKTHIETHVYRKKCTSGYTWQAHQDTRVQEKVHIRTRVQEKVHIKTHVYRKKCTSGHTCTGRSAHQDTRVQEDAHRDTRNKHIRTHVYRKKCTSGRTCTERSAHQDTRGKHIRTHVYRKKERVAQKRNRYLWIEREKGTGQKMVCVQKRLCNSACIKQPFSL